MLNNDLYLLKGLFNCFEGDDTPPVVDDDPGASAAAEAAAKAAAEKKFTQDDLNRHLAAESRKHKAALQQMEKAHQETLANNQSLTTKERAALEDSLKTIQDQLLSKEEQVKRDKKQLEEQYANKLKDTEVERDNWIGRYRHETIDRNLQDAAVSADAFQPGQIVTLLKPMTRLVENIDPKTGKSSGRFDAVIDFPDVDAEGQPTMSVLSPKDAVKRMKERPELYGNLFKSGVVSGIGSNSVTGIAPGSNGKVDLRKAAGDAKTYRELREKNPEALGLRPRGSRR